MTDSEQKALGRIENELKHQTEDLAEIKTLAKSTDERLNQMDVVVGIQAQMLAEHGRQIKDHADNDMKVAAEIGKKIDEQNVKLNLAVQYITVFNGVVKTLAFGGVVAGLIAASIKIYEFFMGPIQ